MNVECNQFKTLNQYIPEEKFPESTGNYLVLLENIIGKRRWDVDNWAKYTEIDKGTIQREVCRWFKWDDRNIMHNDWRVIAWISLPNKFIKLDKEVPWPKECIEKFNNDMDVMKEGGIK